RYTRERPQDQHRSREIFSQARLPLPALNACETGQAADTHSQQKTLARYQGSARRAHPKSPHALPQRARLGGFARESPGSCFLFPIQEFRLANVSLKKLTTSEH